MNKKLVHLVTFTALVLLASCGDNPHIESLGNPTTIDAGSSPVDVICDIQQEFRNLPKPVLANVEYFEASTRSMEVDFSRTRETLPAYYHYELTGPVRAWLRNHTTTELSVSLMPLVLDPDYGGEAAVVLTSLATGRKFRTSQYGYHHSSIATDVSHFMHETGYQTPTDPGHWDNETARQFQVPKQVTIAFQGPSFLSEQESDFSRLVLSETTLNYELKQIQEKLRYYENGLMPSLIYGSDAFETVELLDDWIAVNGLPEPPHSELHNELTALWDTEFIVFSAYPGGIARGLAVYLLGLQKYWPLLYHYDHTVLEAYNHRASTKAEAYRASYHRELIDKAHAIMSAACSEKT